LEFARCSLKPIQKQEHTIVIKTALVTCIKGAN